MKYSEVTKNKRLTNFNDIRDFVVQNTVKIEQPTPKKKKEENSTLLSFGE